MHLWKYVEAIHTMDGTDNAVIFFASIPPQTGEYLQFTHLNFSILLPSVTFLIYT